jgi:hypothetical protein
VVNASQIPQRWREEYAVWARHHPGGLGDRDPRPGFLPCDRPGLHADRAAADRPGSERMPSRESRVRFRDVPGDVFQPSDAGPTIHTPSRCPRRPLLRAAETPRHPSPDPVGSGRAASRQQTGRLGSGRRVRDVSFGPGRDHTQRGSPLMAARAGTPSNDTEGSSDAGGVIGSGIPNANSCPLVHPT